jgi:hypothetical protein
MRKRGMKKYIRTGNNSYLWVFVYYAKLFKSKTK